ncbi:MAG: methyltransferase [Chloroflexota bacterium]
MDHNDHVNLLRPADLKPGGSWADLGSGSGAFTLALRELVGPSAEIYAVDKDRNSLQELARGYVSHFGDAHKLELIHGDFSKDVQLPQLDGALMANSLHYFKDKETVLHHVRSFLKPNGILLLVEYNVDVGNPWVPYPLSFETFRTLAPKGGFTLPRLLGKVPSRFLREFYSAVTYSPAPFPNGEGGGAAGDGG